jgi:hypothetical protein
MLHHAVWQKLAYISEVLTASIIRAMQNDKIGSSLPSQEKILTLPDGENAFSSLSSSKDYKWCSKVAFNYSKVPIFQFKRKRRTVG